MTSKASPRPRRAAAGIDTVRPVLLVTQPIRAGSSPTLLSAAMAASWRAAGTTMANPMPMLNVAYMVAAGTLPASAIRPNTGGGGGSASSS
jgi:hypothetical protein